MAIGNADNSKVDVFICIFGMIRERVWHGLFMGWIIGHGVVFAGEMIEL